jgi:hypothetical protein
MAAKEATSTGSLTTDGGDAAAQSLPRDEEKTPTNVVGYSTEESQKPRDFPWTWKLTALACGIALSWGSSFSENTLGPLKSTLIKELDITNSQVSILHQITLSVQLDLEDRA